MAIVDERPKVSPEGPRGEPEHEAHGLLAWFTTTDHKRIGVAYMVSAFIFFLIGGLHDPRASGRKVYALLVLLGAAAGAGVAAWHLWVQHLPPDPLAGCTPGWNYMVENFPLNKVLKMAFTGHADCSEINWTFLGLAMPFWTLVSFIVIGAAAVWAGFRRR